MTGKTHVGIGVMATVILSEYLPVDLSIVSLVACAFSSILPDIDHPNSIINKYILPVKNKAVKASIYITLGVFLYVLNYFYFDEVYLKAVGIFLVLIGVSSHRNGITHSLTGLLCFTGVYGYMALTYGWKESILPFTIGYGAHLIGDMFTARGIALFFPFRKKRYKMPLTFSVGTWWGNLIEGLIISGGLIYLTWRLPIILSKLK
ncbi:metal-dependent hydrolase [Fonticella tunisiensis]|uniref:Inner membrane protein n=1 Tax=Fonticella tunisiensis TaxID=1096341 RepID=A0A4R7KVC9_9CLOT|nr:metal-dependent hydrolase [Fonticella tunisiensis]TDT63724.1 inner membrane protein [Fonticella tunisiensis]